MPWTRAVMAWMAIALLETGSVALRVFFIAGRIGNQSATLLGVAMSCAIVLAVAWLALRRMYELTRGQRLLIGALWVALTLAFEFAIARPDYNPLRLAILFFGPLPVGLLPQREKLT